MSLQSNPAETHPLLATGIQPIETAEDASALGPATVLPLRPAQPFIKWAGGKRNLAGRLISLFPSKFGTYYEPFLGSGAIFFAARPPSAVLADVNPDLMDCFIQVRDNVDAVIEALSGLPNSKTDYYRIRASVPAEPAARAARTIYLVQLAFNGIYRVHSKTGLFNVPYGQHVDRVVLHEDRLRAASLTLRRASLRTGDFATTTEDAGKGDVVYLDPPYTVAHNSNGFVRYNQRLFTWDDQVRLAALACELVERGCHVVVSNAYHHSIRSLYPGFVRRRIRRASQMAADVEHRRRVYEYVLIGS